MKRAGAEYHFTYFLHHRFFSILIRHIDFTNVWQNKLTVSIYEIFRVLQLHGGLDTSNPLVKCIYTTNVFWTKSLSFTFTEATVFITDNVKRKELVLNASDRSIANRVSYDMGWTNSSLQFTSQSYKNLIYCYCTKVLDPCLHRLLSLMMELLTKHPIKLQMSSIH